MPPGPPGTPLPPGAEPPGPPAPPPRKPPLPVAPLPPAAPAPPPPPPTPLPLPTPLPPLPVAELVPPAPPKPPAPPSAKAGAAVSAVAATRAIANVVNSIDGRTRPVSGPQSLHPPTFPGDAAQVQPLRIQLPRHSILVAMTVAQSAAATAEKNGLALPGTRLAADLDGAGRRSAPALPCRRRYCRPGLRAIASPDVPAANRLYFRFLRKRPPRRRPWPQPFSSFGPG